MAASPQSDALAAQEGEEPALRLPPAGAESMEAGARRIGTVGDGHTGTGSQFLGNADFHCEPHDRRRQLVMPAIKRRSRVALDIVVREGARLARWAAATTPHVATAHVARGLGGPSAAGVCTEGTRNAQREKSARDRAPPRIAAFEGLTRAQRVIAGRLVDGQSLKQIALGLRRHRRTVADHVRELKRKTGSRTLPELVFRISTPHPRGAHAGSDERERRISNFARRHDLTATQAAVIRLILGGRTVAGVARSLGRDRGTVKVHIDAVRRRAGACTCVEIAALVGRQNGHAR